MAVARHQAAQAGHRQAAFPAVFHLVGQRRDDRIAQDGLRHRRRVGIALVAVEAEDHQLQVHADLRRGQSHALGGGHGLEHVRDQRAQLGRAEMRHGRGHAQQPRVAHLQDGVDHGCQSTRPFLDELDLVAVGVFDEGDDRRAVLHRAGFASDLAAAFLDLVTGFVGIVDFQGDVAVAAAQVVLVGVPVVGQLDDGAFGLVLVADKGQRELAVRIVVAAQDAHAEHVGVEVDGFVEVADSQHGV